MRALEAKMTYPALCALRKTGNRSGLERTFALAMERRIVFDAASICKYLGDENSERQVVELAVRLDKLRALETFLQSVADSYAERLFDEYERRKGFQGSAHFDLPETIAAAHSLAGNYDVGIGIAKAGLFSACMFETFGLPVYIVESHRHALSATFRWVDKRPDLKGKKVIVLENDVISGKTMRRVVGQLIHQRPECIDVYFNVGPSDGTGYHSKLENVPERVRNVYHPGNLDYNNFWPGIQILKEKCHP